MAQLADENTREPDAIARERRLRAMLNAPIQAIPSGYGSIPASPGAPATPRRAMPEATLPAWVQARLAAERRRQEELAALGAPRVQLRPPPPPTRPSSGSLADDAALHDPRTRTQRLREILDAPTQGIGAGIGTIHDPTPPRPASAPQEAPRTSEAERRRQEQRVWDVAFGPREPTREEERTWDVAFADPPRSLAAAEEIPQRSEAERRRLDQRVWDLAFVDPPQRAERRIGLWYPTLPREIFVPTLDGLLDPDRPDESALERVRDGFGDTVDGAAGAVGDVVEGALGGLGSWLGDRASGAARRLDDFGEDVTTVARYVDIPGVSRAAHEFRALEDETSRFLEGFGVEIEREFDEGGVWLNAVFDHGLGGTLEYAITNPNPADWLVGDPRDLVQIVKHDGEFPASATNGNQLNQALGMSVAATSSCNERTELGGGIVLYENCRAGVAEEFLEDQGRRAVTVGNFIFVRDSLDLTTNDDLDILFEEIAHVQQYGEYGAGFLIEYFGGSDQGYAKNQFEIDAKAAAIQMRRWWHLQHATNQAAPSPPPRVPRPVPAPTPTPPPQGSTPSDRETGPRKADLA
jgi:hypothetical protein